MAVKRKALITALLTSLPLLSPVAFALQNYSLLSSCGSAVFDVLGTSCNDCFLKTPCKVAWAKQMLLDNILTLFFERNLQILYELSIYTFYGPCLGIGWRWFQNNYFLSALHKAQEILTIGFPEKLNGKSTQIMIKDFLLNLYKIKI